MPPISQTARERRERQEQAFPERFSDGSTWIELADRVGALTPWEADLLIEQVGRPYEAERLKAQMTTLAGIERIQQKLFEVADRLRERADPLHVARWSFAVRVLNAGLQAPARRPRWSDVWGDVHRIQRIIRIRQPAPLRF